MQDIIISLVGTMNDLQNGTALVIWLKSDVHNVQWYVTYIIIFIWKNLTKISFIELLFHAGYYYFSCWNGERLLEWNAWKRIWLQSNVDNVQWYVPYITLSVSLKKLMKISLLFSKNYYFIQNIIISLVGKTNDLLNGLRNGHQNFPLHSCYFFKIV